MWPKNYWCQHFNTVLIFSPYGSNNRVTGLMVVRALRTLAVLDFSNFSVKKFQSSSLWIETMLNRDPRLQTNIGKHDSDIRPDQLLLEKEILSKRAKQTFDYTNLEPADSLVAIPEMFFFLGITINQLTDNLSLRSKPLMFRSRQKGSVDIICRNVKEFANFLKIGKFTRAQMASLVNSVYCPPQTLSAVFCCVGKKVQQLVVDNKMTWSSRIDPIHFPIIEKLAKLYFLVQTLTIPQYSMLEEKTSNLELWLITFSDGSEDYSSSVLYLISSSTVSLRSKVQLITSSSKIHSYSLETEVKTVPQNEMFAALQSTTLMLQVAQYMESMTFQLAGAVVFIDAISVILSLSHHPCRYKVPFKKWISGINSNLFQIALLTKQSKEDLPLYLDQSV